MTTPATLEQLATEVAERIGYPVSDAAVAAAIETLGVRELDVRERFGHRDVFSLANELRPWVAAVAPVADRDEPSPAVGVVLGSAWRFAGYYGRGLFYALPMIVQVATIAVLRLGVLIHLTDGQATVIMVGSVLSFVATGGFVQTIGRLGSVYVGRESYRLARAITYRVLALGLAGSAVAGLALFVLGAVFHVLPVGGLAVAVVYDLVLSLLWLTLAVLYMLQRRELVLVAVLAWVASLGMFLRWGHFGVYTSQWLAAAFGAAVAAYLGFASFNDLLRKTPPERGVEKLPPASELRHDAWPFFWYGLLYFTFVFLDRIVGWTKGPPRGYGIFFHRAYELGMDWALLTLFLTIALLDYTINAFSQRLLPTQKRFGGGNIDQHNRSMQRFYGRQLALLTTLVVVSAVGVYFGGIALRDGVGSTAIEDFFGDSTTYRVYMWAALGYGLLVWGLLNVIFFFYLSESQYAFRSLGLAVIVGAITGLGFSRAGPYWESVVGLAAGAFVFAAATTAYAIRIFGEIDFVYYAAY